MQVAKLLSNEGLAELLRSNPKLLTALTLVLIVVGLGQRLLGPDADWVERKRQRYWLKVNEFITMIGTFSVRELHPYEYACRIHINPSRLGENEDASDAVERVFYQNSIHRNLIASKKFRREGAVRRWTDSSWAKRAHLFSKRQLHIHLVDVDNESAVDVYVHEEPNPISQPVRHFAVDAMEYKEAIDKTHRLFDEMELTYEVRDPPSA